MINCSVSEILTSGARELGILLSAQKVRLILLHIQELNRWNKKINLTSIEDEKQIAIKHFLDSLSCYLVMEDTPEKLVDIGTGAGFPSLPLKILLQDLKCTLIEAKKKKVDFLQYLIERLSLEEVNIIKARAEQVAKKEKRESFDVAVGRAVARLNVFLEYALPLVRVGGYVISQKGKDVTQIREAKNALSVLGGRIEEVRCIELPFLNQTRNLVLVRKVKSTPEKYPRRPGIPEKRPL